MTARIYERLSEVYDLDWGQWPRRYTGFMQELRRQAGMLRASVLDLACGTGTLARELGACGRCHVDGSCTPFLPDDPHEGRLARRLVCAPNDAYLIHDVIDGIVPYHANTDLHGPTDALDPNLHYRRLLSATKAEIGSRELIAMHTALPAGQDADADVLVRRIGVAIHEADATGVFRFPLGLFFMDPADRRGVFAESPVKGSHRFGSTSGDEAHLMAQWPHLQSTLPGLFQQWTHVPPGGASVEMRVEVWDARSAGSSNTGQLLKWTAGGGLVPAYEEDPFDDGTESVYVPLDGTLMTSTPSDPVTLGLDVFGGVPVNTRVYFRAVDSTGAEIPVGDWIFESGIDDPHTVEIYDRLTELFRLVRGP